MTSATIAAGTRAAPAAGTDWVAVARELGPGFASRAPAHDANDSFPVENYRELKERRVFSAGVPAGLGGGGGSHAAPFALLRPPGHPSGAARPGPPHAQPPVRPAGLAV